MDILAPTVFASLWQTLTLYFTWGPVEALAQRVELFSVVGILSLSGILRKWLLLVATLWLGSFYLMNKKLQRGFFCSRVSLLPPVPCHSEAFWLGALFSSWAFSCFSLHSALAHCLNFSEMLSIWWSNLLNLILASLRNALTTGSSVTTNGLQWHTWIWQAACWCVLHQGAQCRLAPPPIHGVRHWTTDEFRAILDSDQGGGWSCAAFWLQRSECSSVVAEISLWQCHHVSTDGLLWEDSYDWSVTDNGMLIRSAGHPCPVLTRKMFQWLELDWFVIFE